MEEIIGIVLEVKYVGKDSEIKVKWVEKNINVMLVCKLYCPVKKNDTIYANCISMINDPNKYYINKPPMVLVAKDKSTIVNHISQSFKIKYPEAIQFYNEISVVAVDMPVYDYITECAQKYADYKTPSTLDMFGPNPHQYDTKVLLEHFHKEFNLRQLYLLGLNNKQIKEFGDCKEIFTKCLTNPYVIYSIPIEKADEILDRMKRNYDLELREKGEIMRLIMNNVNKRKWYCTPTYHFKKFPKFKSYLESLKLDYNLIIDLQCAYISKFHKMETFIANYIIKMVKSDPVKIDSPIDTHFVGENGIPFIRYKANLLSELSEDQKVAIQGSLDHRICIITGGAGCGKSTIIGEIIKNLDERDLRYCLTSYTGRAVNRIRTVTGKKCPSTMHRLINNAKQLPLNDPINNYDYVIIDEISMVNTTLLYEFLVVHPNIKQLVFVGDVNQLEPISEGNLLYQLMKAKCVPTYYLTTNFRFINSNGNDGIILNTTAMLNHNPEYPFEFTKSNNFKIIQGDQNTVFELVKILHQDGIDIKDLVIISPYSKDIRIKQDNTLCIDELNAGVQAIYNPGPGFKDSRGIIWKVNDRVILTKNTPSINQFNGAEGIIIDVNKDSIAVDFGTGQHRFLMEPKNQRYENEDSEEDYGGELTVLKISLSYALSTYRIQGSECDNVIYYLPPWAIECSFLNKNSTYTALTRGKKIMYIITSDIDLLVSSVSRSSPYKCENLATRLMMNLPPIEPYKLKTKIENVVIDVDPDLEYYNNQDDYYDD